MTTTAKLPNFPLLLAVMLFMSPSVSIAETEVKIDVSGKVYSYELREIKTGELLHWLPSSYQPSGESDTDFDRDHTEAAHIEWNGDKTAVVIEEANHQFIGNIWIMTLGERKDAPENRFTPSIQENILSASKLILDRYRFIFSKWIAKDRVELSLTTRYRKEPEALQHYRASFLVELELGNTVSIVSVKRLAND